MTRVKEEALICLMRPSVFRLRGGEVGKDGVSDEGASRDGTG